MATVKLVDDVLLCPTCGYEYLQHESVEAWRRKGEGQPGDVVRIDETSVAVERATGGFAGKGDDVRIRFTCEGCKRRLVLQIKQHGGRTVIEWVDPLPA